MSGLHRNSAYLVKQKSSHRFSLSIATGINERHIASLQALIRDYRDFLGFINGEWAASIALQKQELARCAGELLERSV